MAAHAEACPENAESHRVIYEPPTPLPTVTVLVTARERPASLERTEYPALEFILSGPGAAAANSAARRAHGQVLVFLSGETEAVEPGWLTEMVSHVVRPEVGAVGARLWSPEGNLEDGGLILGLGGIAAPAFRGIPRGHPGYFNRAWLQQNYSAVSAACMAVRKKVFFEGNGFNETNLPLYFYDVDFCLRLRQRGLQVVWTPYANLIFRGSRLREETQSSDEAVYMQKQWGQQLLNDPFYNPNLSLNPPGFMIAIPPRPNDINKASTSQ
jgi:GT2 family glycosyltransferase